MNGRQARLGLMAIVEGGTYSLIIEAAVEVHWGGNRGLRSLVLRLRFGLLAGQSNTATGRASAVDVFTFPPPAISSGLPPWAGTG
jgi:hypothetical protein